MQQVTVIGAGTMGNGITHVFAQNGFTVKMVDVQDAQLEKALAAITKNLGRQVEKGILTEAQKNETLGRISTINNIAKGFSYF